LAVPSIFVTGYADASWWKVGRLVSKSLDDSQVPVRRLYRSFGFAARGIWIARTGRNLRIHLAVAAAVVFLVIGYGLTGSQLGLVIASIATVISAELLNTAIERLCDFVAELHGIGTDPRIRDIKDLAAGAVLVVATGAAVIGVITFGAILA
jgi:diacylglycerol kinase